LLRFINKILERRDIRLAEDESTQRDQLPLTSNNGDKSSISSTMSSCSGAETDASVVDETTLSLSLHTNCDPADSRVVRSIRTNVIARKNRITFWQGSYKTTKVRTFTNKICKVKSNEVYEHSITGNPFDEAKLTSVLKICLRKNTATDQ